MSQANPYEDKKAPVDMTNDSISMFSQGVDVFTRRNHDASQKPFRKQHATDMRAHEQKTDPATGKPLFRPQTTASKKQQRDVTPKRDNDVSQRGGVQNYLYNLHAVKLEQQKRVRKQADRNRQSQALTERG